MKYTNTIIILVLLHITVLYCSQYNDRNKEDTMTKYPSQVVNPTDARAYEAEPTFGAKNLEFLQNQYDRLGMGDSGVNFNDWTKNIYDFSRKTRVMESDNRADARASDLHGDEFSASGVYQFTNDSVDTGRMRMTTGGHDNFNINMEKGGYDWGGDYISSIGNDPTKWTDDQADSMFLANIFAQTGSDEPIIELGKGTKGADWDVYSRFHHTEPDDNTVTRGKEIFGDYAGINY
jgi:hypothetical protein